MFCRLPVDHLQLAHKFLIGGKKHCQPFPLTSGKGSSRDNCHRPQDFGKCFDRFSVIRNRKNPRVDITTDMPDIRYRMCAYLTRPLERVRIAFLVQNKKRVDIPRQNSITVHIRHYKFWQVYRKKSD